MGPRKQFRLLLFRSIVGCSALISFYFALVFITPSSVVVLAHTAIIFTAILSRIFLNEKLNVADLIALVFTVIGVILISKPSIIFPPTLKLIASVELNKTASNSTLSSLTSISSSMKTLLGVSLALFGAATSGIVYLVIRKLCNSKVHWATTTIYVSWFGVPVSLLISCILTGTGITHSDFKSELVTLPMDIFYSVCAACMSILGQVFISIALKYEDASKIAIAKTIGKLNALIKK